MYLDTLFVFSCVAHFQFYYYTHILRIYFFALFAGRPVQLSGQFPVITFIPV